MKLIVFAALTLLHLIAWAQTPSPAVPSEVLSAANFDKLKKLTVTASKTANLPAPVVALLGLGQNGTQVTVKQLEADTERGRYIFTVPVKPESEAVVFSFRDLSGVTYNYLSDSTLTLRAAMSSDVDGTRKLANEQAMEGYLASLKAWALIAPRVKAQ